MSDSDNQRIYIKELGERLHKTMDQLVEMAMREKLALWYEFTNVLVIREKKKKKNVEPNFHELFEARPHQEVLALIHGRGDRLQVAAEYPCLNAKGKLVRISNMVGDEWGETSMIGLNPARLYARLDEVEALERGKGSAAVCGERADAAETRSSCGCQASRAQTSKAPASEETVVLAPQHPCFAPELHIALACWQALLADEQQPERIKKSDLLAWLREHAPQLSKTAAERIAQVVSPGPLPRH